MGRSQFTLRHQLSAGRSEQIATEFLTQRGLKLVPYRTGERVWKRGTGLVMSITFLSLYYEDHKTTVYGWVQKNWGLTARNEGDLYGYSAILPKKRLIKLIDELKCELEAAQPEEEQKNDQLP